MKRIEWLCGTGALVFGLLLTSGCSSDDGTPPVGEVDGSADTNGIDGGGDTAGPDASADAEPSDTSVPPDGAEDVVPTDIEPPPDDVADADDGDASDAVDVDDVDDTTVDGSMEPDGSDGADDTGESGDASAPVPFPAAVRLFPTDDNPGVEMPQCHLASPLAWERDGVTELLVTSGNMVRGLSPDTGEEFWSVEVFAPDGEVGLLVSTPVIVDDMLVVAYALNPASDGPRGVGTRRLRHMVGVIDLTLRAQHPDFAPLELAATFDANDGESTIPFRPSNALNRAALAHVRAETDTLGRVIVTFGNVRDIQPWHGEAFEVSLDDWRSGGPDAALTGTLITTPEVDCGPAGASGSSDRRCGGGLWAPGGHLVRQYEDTYEVLMATGNGQLNVNRDDFANSILRVGPGMSFEPGCDPEACADFDPDEPSLACVESCEDVFIHRFPEDEERPAWGVTICDGLTLFECWEELDYTGGSTPTLATLRSGTEVIVSTGKDGGLYLIDPEQLGTMHDRLQMTEPCGTATDRCIWNWAGTVVSTPVHTVIAGEDLILVPTFMPDATHSAGVYAAAVVEDEEGLHLERRWQLPELGSEEAIARFRRHPSRLALQQTDGWRLAWVVETARPGGMGNLIGIDLDLREIVVRQPLAGPGYRFTQPLVLDDRIYLPSCNSDDGPSRIEAYRIEAQVSE